MSESHSFPPNGKTISLIYFWILPVIIIALFFIKEGIDYWNILTAILIFGIFALDLIFPYKRPYDIIVTPNQGMLEFKYVNGLGQSKSRIINLKTAKISLKYRFINLNYRLYGKLKFGWRLLLYTDSYFKNRIVIRQDDELGYSKEKLDELLDLINKCRDI